MGTVLKQNGYKVKIIDSPCEGYDNERISGDYITYGLDDREIKRKIKSLSPDLVGITSMFSAQFNNALHHCDLIKEVDPEIPVVIGGIHPSLYPMDAIKHPSVDFCIIGEGERRILELVKNVENESFNFDGIAYKEGGKVRVNPMTTRIEDLDSIPYPDYSLVDFEKYIQTGVPYAPFSLKERVVGMLTSRGCPMNCLEGETLINTLYGKIKIKNLAEKYNSIKVLTRDFVTGEIKFVNATHIRKTRKKAELVRVNFDDGTYIDCTPDHRFLTFKNGNQFVPVREMETEAKDLKKGQSVMAVNYEFNSIHRNVCVYWKRRSRFPEEELQRRREKWLGPNNPNWNPELHEDSNHKVVSVEKLPYKKDVYCMEVPSYHWFYANDVLVHNCSFCSTVKFWGRQFRMRSVESIIGEIDYLIEKYRIQEIQFIDDNMTIGRKHCQKLFTHLKKRDIVWCPPHGLMANTLDKEMIRLMAESGAYQLTIAIESGSKRVREEIIKKRVPPKEKIKELIDEGHKYDIQFHLLFILGNFGETRDEINMSLSYPYEVGADSTSFFVLSAMPGSDVYNMAIERGYLSSGLRCDVKTAEMNIPPDSPDYVMPNDELNRLAETETRKYNEYIKNKYPERWERKFRQFLKKHGDKADLILGRVT